MTDRRRVDRALALLTTAIFGLVAAPLLHAEEHRREAHEDADAARQAWEQGSPDPADVLAFALSHAHARHTPHQHSHPKSGAHGDGTLSHLSVALHAAPALPPVERQDVRHAPPRRVVAQLRAAPRYLVPSFAQGPPWLS